MPLLKSSTPGIGGRFQLYCIYYISHSYKSQHPVIIHEVMRMKMVRISKPIEKESYDDFERLIEEDEISAQEEAFLRGWDSY